MKDKLKIQIIGWLLLIVTLLIFGSMIGYDLTEEPTLVARKINNPFNILGVYIGFYLMKLGFGYAAFLIPIILATLSFYLISNFSFNLPRLLKFQILLLILISVTLGFITNVSYLSEFKEVQNYENSGLLGGLLLGLIYDWTGFYGSVLIIFSSLFLFLVSFFKIDLYKSLKDLPKVLINKFSNFEFDFKKIIPDFKKEEVKKEKVKIIQDDSFLKNINAEEDVNNNDEVFEKEFSIKTDHKTNHQADIESNDDKLKVEDVESENELDAISIEKAIIEKEAEIDDQRNKSILKVEWKFPSTDILESSDELSEINEDDIRDRSELLKNSLSNFGVEGSSGAIKTGPIITLFEILPAEGVRVNKFVQLSDDIARVMEAQSVRVLAPIPGSNHVGVEIPNVNPQTIYLKNVINSEKYLKSKAKLKLAIGKGTLGDISILDLVEMPHLLIAGTTGSGKSVSLNTIIVSLLYQLKPEEVKFVIIDPKKVEMSLYRGLANHYLLKFNGIDESIITKKDNAILALRSLEKEMDSRYDLLAEAGKRNISEYNDMMKKSKKDLMPYIVLMIDELADLMMYSPRDVEAPIARLAQLARAVGIHLIVATQRPSVDVITGVIKANFPARIAFQVATKIDSRTILDENGADKLIGKGDMLYQKPGSPAPVRMHGAFVTLKEIEDLVEHIASQPKPSEVIIETFKEESSSMVDGDGIDDDLLHKAIEIIVMSKQGSISLLQRRLSVGYSRAARLIDEMERLKIVGPFTGSKAREVLVDESYLETINED